jgi:hypothetical protein
MAVQFSIYTTDGTTRTYPSTKHIATKQHCSVWKLRVLDSVWEIANVAEYSLVNNSVIFVDALPTSVYSQVEIRVADTADELLDSPTDIAINAAHYADINTNADNIDSIVTNATNIAAINNASSNIGLMTNIYNNMDDINNAEENANIAIAMAEVCTSTYDQFDDRYLGAKATPPLVDNDGNALVYGTLYFDTTQNFMKVWSNAGWINAGSSVNGTTERYTYHATAGQTVFVATYEAGYIDVFLNGSKLENGVDFTAVTAASITLTSPAALNDVVDIICYAVFELSTAPTKDVVAYTVSTVADLASVPSSYTTAIVKDIDRGGTFIWSSTGTANGGTVFAGATGYWTRQYSGAVNVKWFGAVGDGITDDTSAIQTFINTGGGYVPSGIYIVTSPLLVKDRIVIEGVKDSWSPTITRNTVFKWGGAIGGNVIQASKAAIGTHSTSALTSVRLRGFTIDGDNSADVGLFINYASDESVFDSITVIKCKLGVVAAKLWYCRLSNLTARNCSAVGIRIGAQYLDSYDITQVNSVSIGNIRAASCGSRYDAVTNPFGFGSGNRSGGCGIYLLLNSGNAVSTITSENNYGAGLVFRGWHSNSITGIYLEGNAASAVLDGEMAVPYGLILIGYASNGSKSIKTLFMNPDNNNIYAQDVTPIDGLDSTLGIFELDDVNAIASITSESGTNSLIRITNPEAVFASNVGYPLAVGGKSATRFDATYEGTPKTGTNSAALRNGRVTIAGLEKQSGWVSGSTLTLCTVNINTGAQTNGSGGSVLVNINIGTGVSGTSRHAISSTFLLSFVAWQQESTLGLSRISTNLIELGSTVTNSSVLLTDLTVTPVVTITGTTSAKIELNMTPTSIGTESRNSVSASAIILSGGIGGIGQPSAIL